MKGKKEPWARGMSDPTLPMGKKTVRKRLEKKQNFNYGTYMTTPTFSFRMWKYFMSKQTEGFGNLFMSKQTKERKNVYL